MCRFLATLWLAAAAVGTSSGEPPIVIDGRFDDWSEAVGITEIDDPAGDASGAFDVVGVRAVRDEFVFFLELNLGEPLNLQSGPPEEGTLILDVALPGARTLTIDFRGRAATLDGEPISWDRLRFAALPTYASRRQEIRLDLRNLGVALADSVRVSLRGSDDVGPRRLSGREPQRATTRASASIAALPGGEFRLAVMNVLWDGHADAGRGRRVGRLLRAVDADAIALQEAIAREDLPDRDEGEVPDPVSAADRTKRILDRGLEGRWNVVADGLGCVVASRSTLQPVPLGEGVRGAAAIIDSDDDGIDDGDPLVVSVHFKCCGYAGSEEDETRVAEVRALIAAIAPLADRHPVIVAGDYNLVGSSRPRDLLLDQPLGLVETLPLQLGEASATTWRGLSPTESFWPGRLDLICHAPSLEALQTFVLDTADLPADVLDQNGLLREDSLASDHLMMVADFVRN